MPEKNRSPDTMPSLLCNARPLSDTRWSIRFPVGFGCKVRGHYGQGCQLGVESRAGLAGSIRRQLWFNDRPLFPWYSIGHPRRREPLTHARKILGRHGVEMRGEIKPSQR